MQEREDDSQKWFDLATDSEAEEAQKSYFFDNLNWYYSWKLSSHSSLRIAVKFVISPGILVFNLIQLLIRPLE